MRARTIALLSCFLTIGVLVALVNAARAHTHGQPAQIMLALGDSLAAGYQPTDGHAAPPLDTQTGFADLGYAQGYAEDLAVSRRLALVDLACPGETAASMLSTPAQATCETLYRREFGERTQEQAATSYLAHHHGEIALVTLDIGANDLLACVSARTEAVNAACLARAATSIAADLPKILGPLTRALRSDDPRARFVAMNYYDPLLGLAVDPGGARGLAAAKSSLALLGALNAEEEALYRHAGLSLADVASAFSTSEMRPLASVEGNLVPYDVGRVCELTWMCPAKGSSLGADIHPNTSGYHVIATAIEAVLARRSRASH